MSWEVTSETSSGIPPLPDDMYDAVCAQIIDLGTQRWEYEGKSKTGHKVQFVWAIDGQTVEIDGQEKPRIVSKEYSVSLHPKSTLRKDLEGWRGAPFGREGIAKFDISKVIGTSCRLLLGLTKSGKGNRVEAVKKANRQVAIPAGINKILFKLDEYKGGELPPVPNWVQEKIKASPEYRKATGAAPTLVERDIPVEDDGIDSDSIPF
jgi:hypothetical protein